VEGPERSVCRKSGMRWTVIGKVEVWGHRKGSACALDVKCIIRPLTVVKHRPIQVGREGGGRFRKKRAAGVGGTKDFFRKNTGKTAKWTAE